MASFTLDRSRLAGNDFAFVETVIEGRGRAIQLQWSQPANQDLDIYGYAIRAVPAEGQATD